jgi:hypothetical protein
MGCAVMSYSQSVPSSAATLAADALAAGTINTVAGGTFSYCGDGSKATTACFRNPVSVVFDVDGNYYIADRDNCIVREVSAAGIISTVAGTPASCGYGGDGGPATKALLSHITDVKVDGSLNLYIADDQNNRVRKVTHATGVITTIAGTGVAGYNGDLGPATKALLNLPYDLALDSANNVYISDFNNNVIRVVSASSGDINTFAGTGVKSYLNGPAAEAEFNGPEGLAFYNNNLYIADSGNGAVREVASGNVTTYAGTGTPGNFNGAKACASGSAKAALLSTVPALAFDKAGNLYLSNFFNYGAPYGYSYICKVSASGVISTIAGLDSIGFSGDGGPATSAQISEPPGLGFDATGDLLLADVNNQRIREIYGVATVVTTATPVISPASGIYPPNQPVTITDATSGAVIYYTTNGTTPTTSSTKYSTPIVVTATETIKAIAIAPGDLASSVASATYTIDPATAAPTIAPKAGTYGSEQLVTLTDATAGAVLYYTTNGTTPTTTSTRYSTPIPVAATETIKAVAVAPSHADSAVASASYIIAGTPSVLTAPATGISTTAATLNALVNPGDVSGTVSFQYGTSSAALSSSTAVASVAATSTTVHASAALTSLKSKTTYYFRAVVTTIGGTASSAVVSFTTD